MNKLAPFIIALQLLTRIPVPVLLRVKWNEANTGLSQAYYPVIGLLIGLMLYIGSLALMHGSSNMLLNASIMVLFWAVITGALHIDGLADTMDAWVGGYGDTKKTLEIMHDPQCGPIAVVAVVLMLLIKVVALAEMIGYSSLMIVFIPMLARLVIPYYFMFTCYLREQGLAKAISENQPVVLINVVAVLCVIPFLVMTGSFAIKLLVVFVAFNFLLRKILLARFGGITGDVAGLIIEVNETVLLLMVVWLF